MTDQFRRVDGKPKRIRGIMLRVRVDENPDLSYLGTFSQKRAEKFAIQHTRNFWFNADNVENYSEAYENYELVLSYQRGDWNMWGCWAEAHIVLNGVCQVIKTRGLWGTDDHAEASRVAREEELPELMDMLTQLGYEKEIHEHFEANDLIWDED